MVRRITWSSGDKAALFLPCYQIIIIVIKIRIVKYFKKINFYVKEYIKCSLS